MAQRKYLNSTIKETVKRVEKQARKDFIACAKKTNRIMQKEALTMYKSLIQQFYEYETTSYIRHGEPFVGTKEGTNLLAGGDQSKITIHNHGKQSPTLHIALSAEGIEGGYEYDTPERVFECVIHGIRFPFGFSNDNQKRYNPMMVDPDTMKYKGKYIKFNGGTIYDAFMQFDKEWHSMSRKAFYSMWGPYAKKWRSKIKQAK